MTRALQSVIDLQIDLITPGRELLQRSTENAYLYNITVHNSCYLALGELMGVEVYTSDKKLYEKAKGSGLLIYI